MGQQAATVDPAEEITYTPTTHRVSKAKKGKKVHVCEHGCGKVHTVDAPRVRIADSIQGIHPRRTSQVSQSELVHPIYYPPEPLANYSEGVMRQTIALSRYTLVELKSARNRSRG